MSATLIAGTATYSGKPDLLTLKDIFIKKINRNISVFAANYILLHKVTLLTTVYNNKTPAINTNYNEK